MTDGEDEKQLKFIEILLIVGGIIGGLGYKNEEASIRFILALFLLSSLMYYFEVSNPTPPYGKIIRKFFADLTGVFFAVLIVYPLTFSTPIMISFWGSGYPIFNIITNLVGAVCLSVLIFINLQEKSELKHGIMLKPLTPPIIINTILILMVFSFLKS